VHGFLSCLLRLRKQEIWANAHETCDSFSLISYAGCLGLFTVISAKIHSKCASQSKITKNSVKPPILGVQGRSKSSMFVPPKSLSAVLVMIHSKSVSMCNRSRDRLVDSSRNCALWRGYQIRCTHMEDSLNLGGQALHRWNLHLMPNISCIGCPGLPRMVLAQLTLKMCIAAWNREKFTKTPIFGVQGHSRSSMLASLLQIKGCNLMNSYNLLLYCFNLWVYSNTFCSGLRLRPSLLLVSHSVHHYVL